MRTHGRCLSFSNIAQIRNLLRSVLCHDEETHMQRSSCWLKGEREKERMTQTDSEIDMQTERQIHEQTPDGRMDGGTDGQIDGGTDRQTEGRTDRQRERGRRAPYGKCWSRFGQEETVRLSYTAIDESVAA